MVKGSRISPPVVLNKVLNGGCIGQVIESKSNKFKVGEYVKANSGWREYWIFQDVDASKDITKVDPKIGPLQYFLGILGITGITAYVGLFTIGGLREGHDTVLRLTKHYIYLSTWTRHSTLLCLGVLFSPFGTPRND
jgi:NADPH-dependent curcumin reductase CurA